MTTFRLALILAVFLPAAFAMGGPEASTRADEKLELQAGRPRLFFRNAEWKGGLSLAQLRQRATTQPFKDRVRLLHSTRANLALKWLIDGDEKAAADALARLKEFSTKLSTSDEGAELVDVALGYDWLYTWKGFTADDKKGVEDNMLVLAKEMVSNLAGDGAHIFHTRMYAWTAGVGMAGLALHDVRPEGRGLFAFAKKYYEQRLWPARMIQGGAIHNGLSYGPNYMMFPLLQFLESAKSAAGIDYFRREIFRGDLSEDYYPILTPYWLRDMSDFLIYSIRPDMEHVKYADHATEDPAKQFRFMLDIFANEFNDGHAAEMAQRISERFKTSGYHAEWIYMFFAFYNPAIKPKPLDDLPTFRCFSPHGVGHVFWRSDWSADATMLHFRCGDYFENHGHFDQGSFTIFRKGDLALQAGGYWGFDTPHRNHYYKQAIASNTVIFSDPDDPKDEGQQRQINYQHAGTVDEYLAHAQKKPAANPCVETGDIVAVDDPKFVASQSKGFHSVVADVTAAWDSAKVKRYVRSLAIVDNKHIVVVDDIELAKPTVRARWLLHTQEKPAEMLRFINKVQGPPVSYVTQLKGSELVLQFLMPADAKVTVIGGEGHECEVNGVNYSYVKEDKFLKYNKSGKLIPSEGLWRMEAESPKAEAKRVFVTVLTADEPVAIPVQAEAKLDGDKLLVKVGDSTVTFFLNVKK